MNEKKGESALEVKWAQTEEAPKTEEGYENKKSDKEETPLEKMEKEDLIEKIKVLQGQAEKNYDLYLRAQAEMENIKKRNKKEKEDWIKYANETLISELLPVVDNLEKAISHSYNENVMDALREGVELTLKGMKETLAKSGLEDVKAKGEPFDPNFHEAVSQGEDDSLEPGIILHELQKGYTLNRRLIRPAMVVVNKGTPSQ